MRVPDATEVGLVLAALGGRSDAIRLCRALEDAGYSTLGAQLGMQRASDAGAKQTIQINDDWTLSLAK